MRGIAGAQEITDGRIGHKFAGLIKENFDLRPQGNTANLASFVCEAQTEGL